MLLTVAKMTAGYIIGVLIRLNAICVWQLWPSAVDYPIKAVAGAREDIPSLVSSAGTTDITRVYDVNPAVRAGYP